MRLLARHPLLDAATTTGRLTISWAREIAGWTGRIDHEELQQEADEILVEAAAGRGGPGRPEAPRPGRLRGLARPGARPGGRPGRARVRRPVPPPRHHPRQRRAHRGRPDPRVRGRRHRRPGGAGQEPRPGGLPHRRAALPRRPPGGLRAAHPRQDGPRPGRRRHPRRRHHPPVRPPARIDGASVIEDTWLRARAGQHGYLSGKDAEAVACDALIVPVVTGSPDWDLIGEMITLVTDAYNHASAKAGHPAAARGVGGAPVRPRPPRHPVRLRPRRAGLRAAPQPPRQAPQHPQRDPGRRLRRHHPRRHPQGRHRKGQGLRLARRLHPPARPLRRPPRQAQETRRQDQHHRLRDVVSLSP